MTRVLARKTISGLVPADERAQDEFRRVPVGKPVYVEIVAARNPRQHRLYFALLRMLVDAGCFPSIEGASVAVKVACGYVDHFKMKDGEPPIMVPKSISYANMTQTAFAEFFDCAIRQVCERWLPNVTQDDLRKEIEEMVA